MLAAFTREEAFLFGARPENAEMIANAMADVSRHYNMNFDSPTISLVKLLGALALVNVPIMMTLGQKRAAARAQARAAASPSTPEETFAGDGERRRYSFDG